MRVKGRSTMLDMLHMNDRVARFWAKRPSDTRYPGQSLRKLNPERVRLVRRMIEEGRTVRYVQNLLMDRYGVSITKQAVYDVVKRRSYADVV